MLGIDIYTCNMHNRVSQVVQHTYQPGKFPVAYLITIESDQYYHKLGYLDYFPNKDINETEQKNSNTNYRPCDDQLEI